MRVLVTGGAGLIGSHIVDLLLNQGHDVRILDNLEACTHLGRVPDWLPREAEFIRGDVRSMNDIERAVDGIEVIIHQAAYGGFAPELTKMTDVNACGTARIFEALRAKRITPYKIITASSQAVYGEGKYACDACGPCFPGLRSIAQLERADWEMRCPMCGGVARGIPIDEEAPLKLGGIYALTKYFEERVTLALGREWGIPAVALRYSLTYGPRQSVFNPYCGICSIFSTRLLNGLPPIIYEDGRQMRDFVFVGDVASANLLVMKSDAANFRVFNVGTGIGTTVAEFVGLLRNAYNANVQPELPGEFRPTDFRHLIADVTNIRSLGWEPMTPVAKGIDRYVEWILSKPMPAEYFSDAEKTLKNMRIVRRVA